MLKWLVTEGRKDGGGGQEDGEVVQDITTEDPLAALEEGYTRIYSVNR